MLATLALMTGQSTDLMLPEALNTRGQTTEVILARTGRITEDSLEELEAEKMWLIARGQARFVIWAYNFGGFLLSVVYPFFLSLLLSKFYLILYKILFYINTGNH